MAEDYVIEMLHITKEFPGIKANDDITLQLRKGEVHALLGENGAGKSTLMSVLFGLYQPEQGKILKSGKEVQIRNPNDANALGIGMVHQHFKLVECFTVLDNIILGVEPNKLGFLQKAEARKKVMDLSEKYGLRVDPDALVSDISVGMQQRVEILKMLYRDNEILIFDEPTAVLTPQEIDELMEIMRGFKKEGKSILFITHKLNEIMAVADRCTVLRKGKYVGVVDIATTTKEELSRMMVGRDVQLQVEKAPAHPGEVILDVQDVTIPSATHKKNAVKDVTFQVRAGEIVCLAGIEGNGQTEFVYGLTGLEKLSGGSDLKSGRWEPVKVNHYDNLGRLIRVINASGDIENFEYIGASNDFAKKLKNGILVFSGEKSGDELIRKFFHDNGMVSEIRTNEKKKESTYYFNGEIIRTEIFDGLRRVIKSTDAKSTKEYSYSGSNEEPDTVKEYIGGVLANIRHFENGKLTALENSQGKIIKIND